MGDPQQGGDPLSRLPHTAPARLPDRVVLLDPSRRVVVEMRLDPDDVRLNETGRLPAVLLVELMAQAGGLLIEASSPGGGNRAVLAGIKRLHLHDTARVGETVTAECILRRRFGDVYVATCRVRTGRGDLAHGDIQLRHVPGTTP